MPLTDIRGQTGLRLNTFDKPPRKPLTSRQKQSMDMMILLESDCDLTRGLVSFPSCSHYSIPRGRARLRNALASYMSPSFNLPDGRQLDPNTEILVTSGGMYESCQAMEKYY